MNVLDFRFSLADPETPEDALGRSCPEAYPALLPRSREGAIPAGLVVSGDNSIRYALAETLLLCGVAPMFATSVEQAIGDIVTGQHSFILCQDTLRDGKYEDLLHVQRAVRCSLPLIVISPTGDWPEYFQAVDRGAYDFLAYPLIPGELQRIIRNFLNERAVSQSA